VVAVVEQPRLEVLLEVAEQVAVVAIQISTTGNQRLPIREVVEAGPAMEVRPKLEELVGQV
jgi:hypothetical protein